MKSIPIPSTHRDGRYLTPLTCRIPVPRHTTYVETHGSYNARIYWKSRSKVEVLNDLDGEAHNLSRSMIDCQTQVQVLERYALAASSKRVETLSGTEDVITRAVNFALHLHRIACQMPKSVYGVQRRRMRSVPSPLRPIDHAMERLRDVQIEDEAPVEVVARYDWSKALFLCDERQTNWKSDEGEHLMEQLHKCQGQIALIVSGTVDGLSTTDGWQHHSDAKSSNEHIWLKYR